MTVDCRLAGILAGETARRVASKTHWRLILPTSYPSSRSDWPIHIDSRRRSNVSNAQTPAVCRPRGDPERSFDPGTAGEQFRVSLFWKL
jgi:hypothetical protein